VRKGALPSDKRFDRGWFVAVLSRLLESSVDIRFADPPD
jgi:hypothetical protein